jgi:hypothetical protein
VNLLVKNLQKLDIFFTFDGYEAGPHRLLVALTTHQPHHPNCVLAWPPGDPGGYPLLVDGRAELSSGTTKITPIRAILHRPAAPETKQSTPGCLHDCVPLEE